MRLQQRAARLRRWSTSQGRDEGGDEGGVSQGRDEGGDVEEQFVGQVLGQGQGQGGDDVLISERSRRAHAFLYNGRGARREGEGLTPS